MNLKFGTYNFLEGGTDDGSTSRLARQLGTLAQQRADVWAFQECSEWDANGCLEMAEDILDMRGYIARSSKSPRGNVAVLIRTHDPLTREKTIKVTGTRHESLRERERTPFWHGIAVVHADIKGYGHIRFASAHLAPSSPEMRAQEAEFIGLLAGKDTPLIIGGDWNAYALNEPDRDVTGIHDAKVRRKSDTRAAYFLAEYMTDCGAHLGVTTPTVGHTRDDKLAYICDRNYTTLPAGTIKGHMVIIDSNKYSDHFAAVTTFHLDHP